MTRPRRARCCATSSRTSRPSWRCTTSAIRGRRWPGARPTSPTCCCSTTACRAWTGWSSPAASAACRCIATSRSSWSPWSATSRCARPRWMPASSTSWSSRCGPRELRARCRNLLQLRQQSENVKQRALSLEQRLLSSMHEVEERERETLSRLARAIEYRDSGTSAYLERMAHVAGLIAEQLGLSEDEVRDDRDGRAAARHRQDRHSRCGAAEARPAGPRRRPRSCAGIRASATNC